MTQRRPVVVRIALDPARLADAASAIVSARATGQSVAILGSNGRAPNVRELDLLLTALDYLGRTTLRLLPPSAARVAYVRANTQTQQDVHAMLVRLQTQGTAPPATGAAAPTPSPDPSEDP